MLIRYRYLYYSDFFSCPYNVLFFPQAQYPVCDLAQYLVVISFVSFNQDRLLSLSFMTTDIFQDYRPALQDVPHLGHLMFSLDKIQIMHFLQKHQTCSALFMDHVRSHDVSVCLISGDVTFVHNQLRQCPPGFFIIKLLFFRLKLTRKL